MSRPAKRQKIGDDELVDPGTIRRQRSAFLASMSQSQSQRISIRETPAASPASMTQSQSQRISICETPSSRPASMSQDQRQGGLNQSQSQSISIREQRPAFLPSMSRGISPPPSVRPSLSNQANDASTAMHSQSGPDQPPSSVGHNVSDSQPRCIASPFRLTKIRDLPASSNVDAISLHDILGDPLIKEAWVFNFCFDIDWMMQHFDADVRQLVQVKVIHGSWKQEDGNRIAIDDACTRWENVTASKAYLPDPFGTHHSKMFVLFKHDDTAEVIIHTANMLSKDWINMTQAVWKTGALSKTSNASDGELGAIGSGERFKYDLLEYLRVYKKSTQDLVNRLRDYDFSGVRGALVASVPAKIDNTLKVSTAKTHLWGYPQLREVIRHASTVRRTASHKERSHLVAQVSSIATLPAGWLNNLVAAFNTPALGTKLTPTDMSLIYPTAPNVAQSLDGYAAGGSIHTKAQSAAHLKQIESLRSHLCQWTAITDGISAGRALAAPHIKTYIQFDRKPTKQSLEAGQVSVEWALLTSANLSTQAWGNLPRTEVKGKNKIKTSASMDGVVQIQSFEIGVLVWPELFADAEEGTIRMVPTFGRDTPESKVGRTLVEAGDNIVGLRMPYDLPLTAYKAGELPWSPGGTYDEPDSHGRTWR